MFKPNRVGTPWQHQPENTSTSAAAITTTTRPYYEALIWGNVINAAPALDFAADGINWVGTPQNLTASHRIALVQQFSVTQPLEGDTVGVELQGSILFQSKCSILITPIFYKMEAGLSGLLAGADSSEMPKVFGTPLNSIPASAVATVRAHTYKEQIIINSTTVGGVYAHGFAISDPEGAVISLSYFSMHASVRQLNDQQSIGYRDTLR